MTTSTVAATADATAPWDPNAPAAAPPEPEQPAAAKGQQRPSWEALDGFDATAFRARFAETDLGNAKRFAYDWAGQVLAIPALGWLVWDGTHWRTDDTREIDRRAHLTVTLIGREVEHVSVTADDGSGKPVEDRLTAAKRARFGHAKKSQDAPRIRAMIDRAGADNRLVDRVETLDQDPWLLNTTGGTVDLRTGEQHPHEPADRLTRLIDVDYTPGATAPRWNEFLMEVLDGDQELAAYLQRAIGYTLTGDTSEQILFLLHGDGANGKTTFLETIGDLLGRDDGYAASIDMTSLTTAASDRAARSDLARLVGRRLVVGNEIERGAHLDQRLVKTITGGERLTVRHLYREEFEYTPQFKLWLAVNDLPQIAGTDHAIWRRLRVVPFAARIANPDKHLRQRLRRELPGILAWAVQGCLDWRRDGLRTPSAVTTATSRWQHAADPVSRCITDLITFAADGRATNAQIRAAADSWSRDQQTIVRPDAVIARLRQMGAQPGRSNGERLLRGISLVTGTPRDTQPESPYARGCMESLG